MDEPDLEELKERIDARKKKVDAYFKEHLEDLDPALQQLKEKFPKTARLMQEYARDQDPYEKQMDIFMQEDLDSGYVTKHPDDLRFVRNELRDEELFQDFDALDREEKAFRIFTLVVMHNWPIGLSAQHRELDERLEAKDFRTHIGPQSLGAEHLWDCGIETRSPEIGRLEVEGYIDFLRRVKHKYNLPNKGISVFSGPDFVPGVVFEGCVMEDASEGYLGLGSDMARQFGYAPPNNKLAIPFEELKPSTYDFVFIKGAFVAMEKDPKRYTDMTASLLSPGGFVLDCDGCIQKHGFKEVGEERNPLPERTGPGVLPFYTPRAVSIYRKPG